MNPETNDAEARSIGEYLVKLLEVLLDKQEGFSGKRPFGNSDWECELIIPLIQANILEGQVDEDGYLETYDRKEFYKLIFKAVEELYTLREDDIVGTAV